MFSWSVTYDSFRSPSIFCEHIYLADPVLVRIQARRRVATHAAIQGTCVRHSQEASCLPLAPEAFCALLSVRFAVHSASCRRSSCCADGISDRFFPLPSLLAIFGTVNVGAGILRISSAGRAWVLIHPLIQGHNSLSMRASRSRRFLRASDGALRLSLVYA